ncbi:MAG TPA: iron ABC transporter permease [Dehalococcoidia bacterium]|nr:iron ABC transporter permease [Dehalococcoidia bacterium]
MTSQALARVTGLADRIRPLPRLAIVPVLIGTLIAVFIVSLAIGAVDIAPQQVVAILAQRVVGLDLGATYTKQQELVLWNIRLPRILLGLLAGCGLAVAGASLQGIFRNPLADPGLIGASSGGAVGAVGMIMLGIAPLGTYSLPVAAFTGSVLVTGLVYLLSRHGGRTEVVTLILTGVALNAIAGAAIGLMNFYATDAQLRSIVFWSMGSLGGGTWRVVYATTPFVVVGVLLLMTQRRALNLMILGEREAFHLGLSTERVRVQVITLSALISGAVVAAIGIVGFVGLVVPHLMRLLDGPDNRVLLPVSALGGSILLLLADLFARTLLSPLELPLGIVTALVGGPYFLWLLHHTRQTQGGWG